MIDQIDRETERRFVKDHDQEGAEIIEEMV